VAGGINVNRLGDVYSNSGGWHAEVWYDLRVGALALRPALRYMNAGTLFYSGTASSQGEDIDVSVFEIPVDLRFRFNVPVVTPFVTFGPVLRIPSASADKVSGLTPASVAGGLGIGIELAFGPVILYPEIKYSFGITNFTTQELELNGFPQVPEDGQRVNTVMLRVGVGL
jgi:hypothetical protein